MVSTRPDETKIIAYLEKASTEGAKFYIRRRGKPIKSIRFDPSKLHSEIGENLAQYLIEAEESDSQILVMRPNRGIKNVSFLRNSR